MRPIASSRTFDAVRKELDRRRRVTLGFERIDALLGALGHPHRDIPHVVQVVGTNGKGSTAVAMTAALEIDGQHAGAYLSPHVLSYTERIVIEGKFVSEGVFAEAVGEAIEVSDDLGIGATQFELLTAGALKVFRDLGVSWAVLEAGLGARHDATSAALPEAVILTNVSLDHTEYLGNTIEEIAREKLASLRKGNTLITPARDERVVRVAGRESARTGARLVQVGDADPGYAPPDEAADFMARNVALGIRAAEVLLGRALNPGERSRAAAQARNLLPARFEAHRVSGVPVLLDGGHNPEALREALRAVRTRYGARPLSVVFGVLGDKDAASMLSLLGEEAAYLVLTRPVDAGERAVDPAVLLRDHRPTDALGRRATVVHDVRDALREAVGRSEKSRGVVMVTGSFYTVSGVLADLRRGDVG